jgi:hypothetical protein
MKKVDSILERGNRLRAMMEDSLAPSGEAAWASIHGPFHAPK